MLENKMYKKLVTEKVQGEEISRLKVLYLLEKDYGWVKTLVCGREQTLGLMVKGKLYTEKGAEDPMVPDDIAAPPFHIDMELVKFKPGKVLMVMPQVRIPKEILLRTRAIFQLISDAIKTEAVVYALFNINTKKFDIHLCPEQKLNGAHYEVSKEYLNKSICSRTDEVLAFEFHSHPFGHHEGFFSGPDDGNVDNFHTRVYGNITYDITGNKFGFLRCKFHDFKEFMDPNIFFEEVPNTEEVIDAASLVTDEEKAIIAVIAEANKTTSIGRYALGHGRRYEHHGAAFPHRGVGDEYDAMWDRDYDDYYGNSDFGDHNPQFKETPGRKIDDPVPLLEHRSGGKGNYPKDTFRGRGKGEFGGFPSRDNSSPAQRECGGFVYDERTKSWVLKGSNGRGVATIKHPLAMSGKQGRGAPTSVRRFPDAIYDNEWTTKLLFKSPAAKQFEEFLDDTSDDLFLAIEKDAKTGRFVLMAKDSIEETYRW